MSNFTGFATAALQLGLQSILIKPTRGIYGIQKPDGSVLPDIIAQAVIEEQHHDELEITEHPIEQGAAISDHAYKRPAHVILHLGWSNSPSSSGSLLNSAIGAAAAVNPLARKAAGIYNAVTGIQSALSGANSNQINNVYQRLLELQETRSIFVLYTGKRVYTNMVCKSLVTSTDAKTANSMIVTMNCQQVILVNTQTVKIPKGAAKTPNKNASIVEKGANNPVKK